MTLKLKFYSEGYVEVLDVSAPRPLLFEDSHAVRKFILKGQFFFDPISKRFGSLTSAIDFASWADEGSVPIDFAARLSDLVSVPNRDDMEERSIYVWISNAAEGLIAGSEADGQPLDLSVEFGHIRQVINTL